ncbi:hypothetical protein M404DRAFT_541727 [Pisolithus tinctorius Marx 270]|uniref:Uncharacterized protein n=1 Tax=Pisolithus tinctorius Marx 270 TaxID=870435 RepID=A0A0C3PB68_PISTI|nr:hypothetical protein M404DRAFT_541727 [Pisolithus tinctorius Marx 270]
MSCIGLQSVFAYLRSYFYPSSLTGREDPARMDVCETVPVSDMDVSSHSESDVSMDLCEPIPSGELAIDNPNFAADPLPRTSPGAADGLLAEFTPMAVGGGLQHATAKVTAVPDSQEIHSCFWADRCTGPDSLDLCVLWAALFPAVLTARLWPYLLFCLCSGTPQPLRLLPVGSTWFQPSRSQRCHAT